MQKTLRNPGAKNAAEYVYREDALIGYGATSQVYVGFNKKTNETVAIKVISKEILIKRLGEEQTEKLCRTESKAHKLGNNHPNILKIYDRFESTKNFYLVTEYCPEKNLQNMLAEQKNYKIEEKKALKILAGLINAVECIHNHGMIHRDIKVENVLFKDQQPKLADLGSVTFKERSNEYVGTEGNLAPEVILANEENFYGKEVDIWSLGILLHELLYGKRPFGKVRLEDAHKMVSEKKFEALKVDFISEETRSLLSRMLAGDPKERITIKQMKEFDIINQWYKEEEAITLFREEITKLILNQEKYKGLLEKYKIEIKSNPQSKDGLELLFHELSKN